MDYNNVFTSFIINTTSPYNRANYFCGNFKKSPAKDGSWSILKRSLTSQWTFSYCNDIGVTSPSISVWQCWYILNETHDDVNLRYQPDIRILRLDQSDFNVVMISSWQQTLSSRTKSSRTLYHFSISHDNATFIMWQLKNYSSRRLFSVTAKKISIEKGVLKYLQIKSGCILSSS